VVLRTNTVFQRGVWSVLFAQEPFSGSGLADVVFALSFGTNAIVSTLYGGIAVVIGSHLRARRPRSIQGASSYCSVFSFGLDWFLHVL
jgi:hypothetical protein